MIALVRSLSKGKKPLWLTSGANNCKQMMIAISYHEECRADDTDNCCWPESNNKQSWRLFFGDDELCKQSQQHRKWPFDDFRHLILPCAWRGGDFYNESTNWHILPDTYSNPATDYYSLMRTAEICGNYLKNFMNAVACSITGLSRRYVCQKQVQG